MHNQDSIENRKLNIISQIIALENLEVLEAIEHLLLLGLDNFELSITEEEKSLIDSNLQEDSYPDNLPKELSEEIAEHLDYRIGHHESNTDEERDGFDVLNEVAKKYNYEL